MNKPRRRLTLEPLEPRKLLAIVYDPASDGLFLDGSAGPDEFLVSREFPLAGEAIRVEEVGNPVRWFPVATKPIVNITALLRAGNDILTVGADVAIPLNADGGTGNDTITGGAANDTI
jgi:Ca2+-binding RTX toxin-like protein